MSVSSRDEILFKYSEWPFYWLTRVADRYLQQLEVALKAIDLDIPRWRVLMQLKGNNRVGVSDIAEHAIVKLPTMTKIIQRMEAEGLITCHVREADARVTEVMLTAQGHAARRKAWTEADRIYRQAFADLKPGKVKTLTTLLNQVFANLTLRADDRRG
jgi:MarR family transcriptional regulator, organic hydroperoxide resistance regulator